LCGVNPDPFSLRELAWMAEHRLRKQWEIAGEILALIFNCNRGPKTEPASPSDFGPFAVYRSVNDDVVKVTPREFVAILANALKAKSK
jgi:hypothetical protein